MIKLKANTIIKKIFSPNDSIRERIFSGVVWVYFLEMGQKFLRMLQLIVLARFLDPKSFGIVGFALVVVNAVNAFSETGFKTAVVQRDVVNRKVLDTAWTVSFLRGIFIFFLIFASAPFISKYFSSERLIPVIRVLAFNFILTGFENIGLALLTKDLNFKKISLWELWGFLTNFITSIPLAFYLKNEWAIVAGLVMSNFVKTVLSFYFHEYRPKLKIDFPIARSIYDYGKWVGGAKVSNYLSDQIDKIVLAKLFGMYELGIYTVSYQLAEFSSRIIDQMRRFLFPTFSQLKKKRERITDTYLAYLNIVSFLLFPVLGCLFVMADEIVLVFLGEKWMLAAAPLKILAFGMAFRVITIASFPLLNAIGISKAVFNISLVRNIAMAMMIYPMGKYLGINGIAYSYTISAIIGFPLCLVLLLKHAEFKLSDLKIFMFPVLGTLSIISAIVLWKTFILSQSILYFAIEIIIAICSYILCGIIMNKILKLNVFEKIMFVKKIIYSNT